MTVQISIESSPKSVAVADATRTFSEQGGSIGRAADCSWQLEDPERFLSGLHCEISYSGAGFVLIDNSTNGTFINSNPEPIGKGASVPLADGDIIEIGDYKLKVSMWSVTGASTDTADALDDPFSDPGLPPAESDPFGDYSPSVGQGDPFGPPDALGDDFSLDSTPEEKDPLAMLDKQGFSQGSSAPPPDRTDDIFGATGASMSGAASLGDSISWPEASPENQIPEDWGSDFDLLGDEPPPVEPPAPTPMPMEPVARPNSAPKGPPDSSRHVDPFDMADELPQSMPLTDRPVNRAMPEPSSPPPRPQPSTASHSSVGAPLDTDSADALIKAMGLNPSTLNPRQKLEISEQVGTLMRDVVGGMMQMLRSRASIKNEFRMDVTTIQPAENNPLKFSVDVDEALENMFVRKSSAYKGAEEAFNEGFSGIAEHQMAIIAGIREAFEGMIKRFDPQSLEQQFNLGSKGSIIPGARAAKNWSAYEKYYAQINNNLDNSFQFLFGDEFVQAYEEQLRKLAIARSQP